MSGSILNLNPLFLQALAFTGGALLAITLSAWWLFFSPMKAAVGPVGRPSPRLAGWLAALLGLSTAQTVVGALWDASMHLQTGEVPGGADFLWPPHILIYSGFLFAWVVAVAATFIVARPAWRAGIRDPRQWVRRNPYVGAVALTSLYALFSIPGDAIWHELFGVDLTAWSPPHVLLAIMMAASAVCAVGLLVATRPAVTRRAWADAAIVVLLSLALNVLYIVGVLEWELPGGLAGSPGAPGARPIWAYPLVGGALAFFVLILAKRLVQFRWAATATAAVFYTFRLGITAGLGLSGNVMPYVPVMFLLGAVLVDAVPWQRVTSLVGRNLAAAAVFTAGYAVLALPILATRGHLPRFTVADMAIAVATMLAASLVLYPAARLAGKGLLGRGA